MTGKLVGRPPKTSGAPLADVLLSYREATGLTREQVAERAQLSPNTLMTLEQGRTADPGFFKVAAVCGALSVDLDQIHRATQGRTSSAAMRHGIVSVGYEGKAIDEFVEALSAAGVDVLADVRMTPLSRKAGFSKNRLAEALADAGIEYVHLRALGNPKSNREPFWDGRVEEGREAFRGLLGGQAATSALDELLALATSSVVAVLCFEHEQERCHRHVVIDEVTRRQPVPVLALR